MIYSIETNTKEELEIKRIGFFHDHCYHLFFGRVEDVPEKFKKHIKKHLKFIFIYEQ
jgi:hypothetical protein